jgi:hypothetical protein
VRLDFFTHSKFTGGFPGMVRGQPMTMSGHLGRDGAGPVGKTLPVVKGASSKFSQRRLTP